MLTALVCLLLLCISAELYVVIRGIGGMREIVLQTEEHGLLLQLGSECLGEQLAPLWREYEHSRWLHRLQHWQRLGIAMQLLLHGSFASVRMESLPSAGYSRLLFGELQRELAREIPSHLAAICDSADGQLAARKLARLLTLACYARLCRDWGEGKQHFLNATTGETRNRLAGIFEMLDNTVPVIRAQSGAS